MTTVPPRPTRPRRFDSPEQEAFLKDKAVTAYTQAAQMTDEGYPDLAWGRALEAFGDAAGAKAKYQAAAATFKGVEVDDFGYNYLWMAQYRLKQWDYSNMKPNSPKPLTVGRLTDEVVYKRLAPGVRDPGRRCAHDNRQRQTADEEPAGSNAESIDGDRRRQSVCSEGERGGRPVEMAHGPTTAMWGRLRYCSA